MTDNSVGDATMLPALLVPIPPDETLASVSGSGAYDTKAWVNTEQDKAAPI